MVHPEVGKTIQLVVYRTLFKLGRNPMLNVAVVGKTEDVATKSVRMMKELIEKSHELGEVFPEMIPAEPWTESAFTIRRGSISRDPSVLAVGLKGTIISSRVDVLIFDDVLDLSNTQDPEQRKWVLRRIRTFLDRLSADGVAIFLTNAWHPDDAAHALEKEGKANPRDGWRCERFPSIDPETGEPTWPEQWPEERLERERVVLGPLDFARAHLCLARDEGESPYDKDAIDAARTMANELGLDLCYATDISDYPGAQIYVGVDLAFTKKKSSNLTSLVALLLWPEDLKRQVLWIDAGRYGSREIRDRVLDFDRRYPGAVFIVENVGAQRWILDIIANQDDLPIADRRLPNCIPFRTGTNKAHPQFGVEGIAVEISAGNWIVPDTGPPEAVRQVLELIGEMLYYVRGGHTGDRLMAAWFAREGCRRGALAGRPESETEDDGSGVRVFDSDDKRNGSLTLAT